MLAVYQFLFDTGGYSPHGFCLSWQPSVLYTHLMSDIMLGLSYVSVALTILVFTRRRADLEFPWLFHAFTIVFGLCGVSHLMEGVTLWLPVYGAQAAFKAATGMASVATAGLAWVLLPKALALPSPSALGAVNAQLRREIEEHRRTARELTAAKEAAERASAAKSDFVAIMSHELRTPLNAVLGFSETLSREVFGPLNAKQKEYVRHVHESGSHLLKLINNILDLSRIDAGRLELEREPVDVAEVVALSAELMRGHASERGLSLEVETDSGLPTMMVDGVRLKQVLLNLLSNAIKFTPKGGRVRVAARPAGDGGVELAVSDTGIGMRASQIPRALEMFTQVDNTLTRKYEGAGIGLPLSKALVELHHGTLAIASAPDHGTTVTVHLPPAPAPAPA